RRQVGWSDPSDPGVAEIQSAFRTSHSEVLVSALLLFLEKKTSIRGREPPRKLSHDQKAFCRCTSDLVCCNGRAQRQRGRRRDASVQRDDNFQRSVRKRRVGSPVAGGRVLGRWRQSDPI